MKTSVNFRTAAVWLACIGFLSPTAVFGAQPLDTPITKNAPVVKDVALGSGNTLVGQVVDGQGQRMANVHVVIQSNSQELARTKTDTEGRFQAAGLHGGVYQISAGSTGGVYRLWSATAAPPAATQDLLLVDSKATVLRGQCASGNCGNGGGYVDAGYPVVQGGEYGAGACGDACGSCGDACGGTCGGCGGGILGILSNPWVIGAAIACAIAIPLALDDDDAS